MLAGFIVMAKTRILRVAIACDIGPFRCSVEDLFQFPVGLRLLLLVIAESLELEHLVLTIRHRI